MLVLARKVNEKIVLTDKNGDIVAEITVAMVRGDKVKLGFEADADIRIHRSELLTRPAPSDTETPRSEPLQKSTTS